MADIRIEDTLFAHHQQLLMRRLERELGLQARISDDMLDLVSTYSALTETGYVQLPFMLERPVGVPSPHFWVSLSDGPDIVAMAGLRVMTNGDEGQHAADFFADGGLYPQQGEKIEPYIRGTGCRLAPGARFGYLGAGWVHRRWRGHGLSGYLARIINDEAALRSKRGLAWLTCMTFDPMYQAGLNLRAGCWHHMHVDKVLEGYLAALDKDVKMYLSYSSIDELAALYALELRYLELGLVVPWLRPHDDSSAPAVLARHARTAAQGNFAESTATAA
ncbi:MAG TPA: hypothetical protein VHA82_02040 [Ramlibacter sp.]|uniref:hypothetical protein n=1 Tax=Ramlibacter sp. TaxID=1917967 RepID=UPI002BAA8081|nr:hypothetical protein [Ramlibacter sp.]HVZ42561.1 hypothetical protein [Ramlibacter sp.]